MAFLPGKFEFVKETVEVAVFKITMEEIKPTDKYVEAIRNFPTPTNISKLVLAHQSSGQQFRQERTHGSIPSPTEPVHTIPVEQ